MDSVTMTRVVAGLITVILLFVLISRRRRKT
jgi:LPXTG-motif cell wall-anchored protein